MRRVTHSWLEAYESALKESDPNKLIGRIEYALNALERRYADWMIDPGTPAELTAIQKCISALQRLLRQEQPGHRSAPPLHYESRKSSIDVTRSLLSSADHPRPGRL
jgi:hypothetical protein